MSTVVQIEMLEERAKALAERGDAATERAQHLQTQVRELTEKLLASEELRQQKDALIEELRLTKHAKVLLLHPLYSTCMLDIFSFRQC
jgi:uncharacterized coiled-coil DUF342 family protein